MNEYIKQNDIKSHPKSLSFNSMTIILKQIENAVCRINNGKCQGTGFFCKIRSYDDSINVLMTNSHILDKNDILPGKKINIYLNKKIFEIIIDEFRITYINPLYDVTIIEIKENDGINSTSFLEIDDGIFDDDFNNNYKQKQVYLLHYIKNDGQISHGLIKRISEDNYNLEHCCNSTAGSAGGPIINGENWKVIGIHKGTSRTKNINLGTFLKGLIEDFNKKININKNSINKKK